MHRLIALLGLLLLTGCLGAGPTPQQQELWARTPRMGEIDWTKEQKAAKDDGICRG